jgi:Tol biopolymer transport system component
VITYEELLNELWPNLVVNANTLNKTVAQLRKALNFDGQKHKLIKTHSKQGYSLESDIDWTNYQAKSDEVKMLSLAKSKLIFPSIGFLLVGIVVFMGMAFWSMQAPENSEWKVKEFHYRTATDDMEFDPIYSSNGDYILFHRYTSDHNLSNLWALETKTQKAYILTQKPGNYAHQSLSPENKQLAFIQRFSCGLESKKPTCYRLMQLDFKQALQTPQKPIELLGSKNTKMKKPVWIDSENIALMQQVDEKWRVIVYSTKSGKTSRLFEVQSGNVVTFSWSPELQMFALIHYEDNTQSIVLLEKDGQLHSRNTLQYPSNVPTHLFVFPEFIHGTELLGFTDGSHLYTLTFHGKVNRTDLTLEGRFGNPIFHHDGKRMLVVKGQSDTDINQFTLIDDIASNTKNAVIPSSTIARSTSVEDMAKFSPDGKSLAMITERTGQAQIMLLNQDGNRLISDFAKGAYVQNIYWDISGKSVLALVDRKLHRVGLDSSTSEFSFGYPIINLFSWDSNNNLAVANIVHEGRILCVEIDIEKGGFKIITERIVHWAAKDNSGGILYLDEMKRIWKHTEFEDLMLRSLSDEVGQNQHLIIQDGTIWGINDNKRLWSYDLSKSTLIHHGQMPENTEDLMDIRNNDILFSRLISVTKEVVEIEFEDTY